MLNSSHGKGAGSFRVSSGLYGRGFQKLVAPNSGYLYNLPSPWDCFLGIGTLEASIQAAGGI